MAQHIDENRLVHDNRLISIKMEQLANSALAKSELTAVQAHILQYILGRSESGTTLTAIHREFDCSMGSLSCILKRLREKGYIRMEGCKSDDRQKLIFATEKGEESSAFLNSALGSVKKRALRLLHRIRARAARRVTEENAPEPVRACEITAIGGI